MTSPPEQIVCVECGGVARLISQLPPDEPIEPGTPLAYTCPDCNHRLDVVWGEDE